MKTIGEEYAIALYELAAEADSVDVILSELEAISKLLLDNPDYVKLLDTPTLEEATRLKLARSAFSDASEYTRSFLLLLVEAKRLFCFFDAYKAFAALYDKEHNIIRAEAVTATPLAAKQCEQIKEKLQKKTGKTVVLTNTVDKSILGGVLLRYDGEEIDKSLRTSLKSISDMISQANI